MSGGETWRPEPRSEFSVTKNKSGIASQAAMPDLFLWLNQPKPKIGLGAIRLRKCI
jgi:hypothetical protein